MNTINGIVQDAQGNPLGVLVTVTSQSTPQSSGQDVEVNTVFTKRSDPTTGAFTLSLQPGVYLVNFATDPLQTNVTISVPVGSATYNFADVVSSNQPALPGAPANQTWNGQWAGNITFLPLVAPPTPTYSVITYSGGNINAAGGENYSYFISYVTATGQTICSTMLAVAENPSAHANQANRIFLTPNVSGVTSINIWRTYVDSGHAYGISSFPLNVGLLATVSAAMGYYDDWESTVQFAARVVTSTVPPLFNSTAGQLLSSSGNVAAFITDQGLFFPGANCRVKYGSGLQVYNFTTQLWYTLLVTGALGHEQLGIDSGNPD